MQSSVCGTDGASSVQVSYPGIVLIGERHEDLPTNDGDDSSVVDDDSDASSSSSDVSIDEADVLLYRRAFIELLCREEFGVDVVLSDDGQRLMNKHQERLGRSLERLSKELYSKDTHFVLELIQNADDNDYSSDMLEYVNDMVH